MQIHYNCCVLFCFLMWPDNMKAGNKKMSSGPCKSRWGCQGCGMNQRKHAAKISPGLESEGRLLTVQAPASIAWIDRYFEAICEKWPYQLWWERSFTAGVLGPSSCGVWTRPWQLDRRWYSHQWHCPRKAWIECTRDHLGCRMTWVEEMRLEGSSGT